MSLPVSGPISLLNLQEEFGGSNPIAFNEYYRGGPYVSSALTEIPSSGATGLTPINIDYVGGRFYVQMSDGSAWAANA